MVPLKSKVNCVELSTESIVIVLAPPPPAVNAPAMVWEVVDVKEIVRGAAPGVNVKSLKVVYKLFVTFQVRFQRRAASTNITIIMNGSVHGVMI